MKISHSNILIPQERNITFGFETDFMSNTKSLLNVSFRIVKYFVPYSNIFDYFDWKLEVMFLISRNWMWLPVMWEPFSFLNEEKTTSVIEIRKRKRPTVVNRII